MRFVPILALTAVAACETKPSPPTVDEGLCSGGKQLAANSGDSIARSIDRSIPGLRRDTAIVFGKSSEGAMVTASYKDSLPRRLQAEYMGEMGKAVETYYFDSALVLFSSRSYQYDKPLSGRIVDSSVTRIDFTKAGALPGVRDSLCREANSLRADMKEP